MSDASRYRIHGVRLTCKHCAGELFTHRTGQLNTAGLTFLNLDWLNPSADVYVCQRCGFLHWFLDAGHRREVDADEEASPPLPPEPADLDDASTTTQCLSCGAVIPAGKDTCENCGWTYRN